MKIRTQLIVGFVIFALLLIIISSLVVSTNQQADELMQQEGTANNIALEVGELGYLSNDYILYREPQQAERWNAKFDSIAGDIAGLFVKLPEQQAIVNNLESNLRNTKSVFDDIVASQARSGTGADMGFVQLSWSRMTVQNQGMIFDAGRLAHLLSDEVNGLRQTRIVLIFALMGTFSAFLLTSYLLFYRRTLKSISVLSEGARIIGSGNLNYTIEEGRADEIGELSRSFNNMTSSLREVTASKGDLEHEVYERKRAEEALVLKNKDLYSLNEELTFTQDELHRNLEELIRTGEELSKSEEKYRNLFEKMAEGFALHEIICDENGDPADYRFLEINPAFEQMTGLKRADMVGRLVSEILPGLEPHWLDKYGSVALSGKAIHFDSYSAPLDRHYDVFAYCPAPRQFAVLFNDITDRKQAEEDLSKKNEELSAINEELTATQEELRRNYNELRETSQSLQETGQYLESLINYANAPIIVWDPSFRITRFNRASERLTGRTSASAIGQPLDILFSLQTRDTSMGLIHRAMTGERWDVVEIPIMGGDGTDRSVLWNSAPIYENDGTTIISIIAQGQDITDRKKSEEALKEYAENLMRSNRELEQFAYVASHDLREPLRMVTSFSQLLEERYKGRLDPDADEFIHYIVDGGTRMDALVNDLLEFSRITSRAKPFEPTDMNAVVGDALRNLSIATQESGVAIQSDVLPIVSVDRSQMVQVYQNLIANAIKFRGKNHPDIHIGAIRQLDEWVFSVSDNGIGIDPEYWDKIFEIFKRLHTREEYPGTGIGLAICRRIIERHGGRIWVESEEGKGSTFFFSLPTVDS